LDGQRAGGVAALAGQTSGQLGDLEGGANNSNSLLMGEEEGHVGEPPIPEPPMNLL